ncbi:nitrate- and nitrite sensing domain-containing protein, partial [Streptomyces sp. B1866]|uniref:sensor histidine kinase n=1 Tax=Streptomyces sp. B1866 TaxID=3075431 RepID=UPI00288FD8C0
MQGRFKRDGSASADPEARGGTDRGSSPQRAQGTGRAPGGQGPGPGAHGGAGSGEGAARPKAPSGPGPRIAVRNWRISYRLISLLALPVVAATAFGGLRIESSVDKIDQLDQMKLLTKMTQRATYLADRLQDERDESAGPLSRSGDAQDDGVVATRQDSDTAIAAFRAASRDIDLTDPGMLGVQATLNEIDRQLAMLKGIRREAYTDPEDITETVQKYDEVISSLLDLSRDMAQATSNRDMINRTRAMATFAAAKDYASAQRAIISAALANRRGPQMSANDRRYGLGAMQKEGEELKRFEQIRDSDADELLTPLKGGQPEVNLADRFARRVLQNPNGLAAESRTYRDWYEQDTTKIKAMSDIQQTLLSEMDQKARSLRAEAIREGVLNGAMILVVLIVSVGGALVVARTMVSNLRRLQDTAQEVAQKRLPELVKQLSESDPQDVDTSVESVGVHSRDEIGKVAAAFDDVHREAVRLAAEQALLRGNVNAMFTNLSRRSQGLIQRQLSLISELESREADPDQLSSLFKLDHLATRMRRNGENLLVLAGEEPGRRWTKPVVLAGEEPGRRWTKPVPLVDVLRAAASEVEQYERIELSSVPATEVAGRVVNDLVHLLAELLENATSFSSPQTKVKVTGHALPDGRVLVEIHDTGIGLSPEDLAAINERLASPPTVDVSVSRRMGLFVVGRLSLRHGIRIQLRPSDSGGTTALVMLPVDVTQGGRKAGTVGKVGTARTGANGGQSAGAASAAGAASGLAASSPARPQIPASEPRTALTSSGLPTRPVGGSGTPGGPPPSGPNLFEGGRSTGRGPGQRDAVPPARAG